MYLWIKGKHYQKEGSNGASKGFKYRAYLYPNLLAYRKAQSAAQKCTPEVHPRSKLTECPEQQEQQFK